MLLPIQDSSLAYGRRNEENHLRELIEDAQALLETEPRRGLQKALEARRIAKRFKHPPHVAWASLRGAACACRMDRLVLARSMCEDAMWDFTAQGDIRGQAGSLNLMGVVSHEMGETDKAYGHFNGALSYARQDIDRHFEVAVLGNLALTAQTLGDIESAMRWTVQALEMATELRANDQRARLLLGSVSLALAMELPDRAEENAVEAHSLVESLQLIGLRVSVLLALSQVAEQRQDMQGAVGYAKEALAQAAQVSAPAREVVQAQLQLGRSLMMSGEIVESSDTLQQAMEGAVNAGSPELEVAATTQYALAQMSHARWSLAREMLSRAEALARRTGCRSELCTVLLSQAELEERSGHPQAALAAFRAYHNLDREVFGERQARLTQALLVTHEVEKHRRLTAQLESANRELVFAANHDSLTHALNRRAFLEGVRSTIAQRRGDVALVLFDLDHFKQINDRFGHGIGDAVLQHVVRICRKNLRDSDLLCRWGGEEFAAFLPSTSPAAALAVTERLRVAIQEYEWQVLHPQLAVTTSLGVGSWRPSGASQLDNALSQVDRALYHAKHSGRNRVCVVNQAESAVNGG